MFAKDQQIVEIAMQRVVNTTSQGSMDQAIAEACYHREAVAIVTAVEPSLKQYSLSDEDWHVIKHTFDFLQPFKEICKRNEGTEATLDQYQECLDFLHHHYETSEIKHTADSAILTAINTSWSLFNKYYEKVDENPVYIASVLLHPSKRKAYLIKVWDPRWINSGIQRSRELWQQYREWFPDRVAGSAVVEASADQGSREPSAFELYQRRNQALSQKDDFEAFIEAPPTKLAAGSTALTYWSSADQRAAYPLLSKLAIDVLSAFVMSAASKRTFSNVRRNTSWERSRLGAESIEQNELSRD
ncbi:hypothetical protein KC333_g6405 [Hortaea werneckii]|nr:hypothetical protein KC333_g6405 [Hortaea werneckii]KAI7315228.1 hypothetical protein KC326_g4766 [Hortaea werneckii]